MPKVGRAYPLAEVLGLIQALRPHSGSVDMTSAAARPVHLMADLATVLNIKLYSKLEVSLSLQPGLLEKTRNCLSPPWWHHFMKNEIFLRDLQISTWIHGVVWGQMGIIHFLRKPDILRMKTFGLLSTFFHFSFVLEFQCMITFVSFCGFWTFWLSPSACETFRFSHFLKGRIFNLGLDIIVCCCKVQPKKTWLAW